MPSHMGWEVVVTGEGRPTVRVIHHENGALLAEADIVRRNGGWRAVSTGPNGAPSESPPFDVADEAARWFAGRVEADEVRRK